MELHPGLVPPEGTKALLFDLDGTLVNSLDVDRECWTTVLAQHGRFITSQWYQEHCGLSLEAFLLAALPDASDAERQIAGEESTVLYASRIRDIEPIERVIEVARAYHGKLSMAVVTGGPWSLVEPSLEAVGIQDLFDQVFTSDLVENSKPSPDLYLLAMERLGVQPDECIAYEDSTSGRAAALAAGIEVIDVREHSPAHSRDGSDETVALLQKIHPELMPPPGTRAIFFDLDGTLVDNLSLYLKCWDTVFQPRGFQLTLDWFNTVAGYPVVPFIEAALPHLSEEERAVVIHDGIELFMNRLHELRPMEAVVQVAHAFHTRLPLAVVSGSSRDVVDATVGAVGLESLFEFIVSKDDVQHTKPAPDCYLLALEKMGLEPHQVVTYEDSDTGIDAAVAAGIKVFDIRPYVPGPQFP